MPSPLQRAAEKAAKRNGLPVSIFLSLVNHESGWQPDVVSPAGAQGLTQLMPATARSLGVSNPFDPIQNLDGGARYLRQQLDRFGSIRLALAAYNAGPGAVESGAWTRYKETQRYVSSILGSQAGETVSPSGGITREHAQPSTPVLPSLVPMSSAVPNDLWGGDLIAKTAFENLGRIARGWKPSSTLAALVASSQMPAATVPTSLMPSLSAPEAQPQETTATPPPLSAEKLGKVIVAPGANRQGVGLNPAVVDFVSQIAGIYGKPLTIGTGTSHNQFVLGTHRESAHWTGNAADIPASGAALTRLGQAALVAAGMDPAQARRQQGGLFNIDGYQVIFNSMQGGNHYNHLHVGLRG